MSLPAFLEKSHRAAALEVFYKPYDLQQLCLLTQLTQFQKRANHFF